MTGDAASDRSGLLVSASGSTRGATRAQTSVTVMAPVGGIQTVSQPYSHSHSRRFSENETAVIRWDYGNPTFGTCQETIQGGNHFRYWVQDGKDADRCEIFRSCTDFIVSYTASAGPYF